MSKSPQDSFYASRLFIFWGFNKGCVWISWKHQTEHKRTVITLLTTILIYARIDNKQKSGAKGVSIFWDSRTILEKAGKVIPYWNLRPAVRNSRMPYPELRSDQGKPKSENQATDKRAKCQNAWTL